MIALMMAMLSPCGAQRSELGSAPLENRYLTSSMLPWSTAALRISPRPSSQWLTSSPPSSRRTAKMGWLRHMLVRSMLRKSISSLQVNFRSLKPAAKVKDKILG